MTMAENIPDIWTQACPDLQIIADAVSEELKNEVDIRPKRGLWYEAFRSVSPKQVNVVILGQDPYH